MYTRDNADLLSGRSFVMSFAGHWSTTIDKTINPMTEELFYLEPSTECA